VLNATGRTGLAVQLQRALTARGYTAGSARTDDRHLARTVVDYAPGQQAAASTLAGLVGSTDVVADPTLPAGHLRVVEGADLTMPSAAPPSADTPSTGNSAAPGPATSPAALNPLPGGGIPCVK
jgi:hypothetical protein